MSIVPWHEEDRSGWFGNVHLFAPAVITTPPWATHERLSDCAADEIVVADCCLCRMRADETVCTITTAPPLPHGMTPNERMDHIYSNSSYFYDASVDIQCAEGFGCTVKPRRRSSRHLREPWYECY